ncbi:FMN-binding protein [bacterium]|nr:FMN-binding protein [bacterium]
MKTCLIILITMSIVFTADIINAKPKEFMSEEDALRMVFSDTTISVEKVEFNPSKEQMTRIEELANVVLDEGWDSKHNVYIGKKNGKVVRYAVVGNCKFKRQPIKYMLGVEPDGTVFNLFVLSYTNPEYEDVIAERDFLDQFKGKNLAGGELTLDDGIDGVTHATVSSGALVRGSRKALAVLNVLYGVGAKP